MRWLFHPKVTMGALVSGSVFICAQCVGTIIASRQLESMKELAVLQPWILGVDVGLGALALLCLLVAALGRSIAWIIDNCMPPPAPPTPPP